MKPCRILLPLLFAALPPILFAAESNRIFPATKPARPDAAKMISVLRGQKPEATSTEGSAPAKITGPVLKPAPAIERRSKIALEAAPKGLPSPGSGGTERIKRGRVPAGGVSVHEEEDPSSKTLYMKKGNTSAEGVATPPSPSLPSPVKAGRIPAEGDPAPPRPRPSNPGGGSLLVGGFSEEGGSGAYGASVRPPEIRYRVDASSQLSTDTVKFVKGGVELADPASYDYLLTLAEALASVELADERFVVEGHASAEGSDYNNLVLSQRRANAIFEFLASRGVDPDRLLAVGHGEAQARFADHEPDILRAQDRQVIVFKLAE